MDFYCDESLVDSEAPPLSDSTPSRSADYGASEDNEDQRSVVVLSGPYSPISSAEAPRSPTPEESLQELLDEASSLLFGPTARGPLPMLLPSPRIQYGGVIWLVSSFLHGQGHIGSSNQAIRNMELFVPAYLGKESLVRIILATMQALACIPQAKEIFLYWAARGGRDFGNLEETAAGRCPQLQPWTSGDCWSFGTWALAVQVATRFLDQETVEPEEMFVERIRDLYAAAGPDVWIVDVMVMTLFFLHSAKWFWVTLFQETRQ